MTKWIGLIALLSMALGMLACSNEADRLYRRAKDAANDDGDYEAAIELVNRAIEIDPSEGRLYRRKGDWLRELERIDEALAAYDMAVTVDNPSDSAHSKGIELCLDLNRLDEAEGWIQRAEADLTDPDDRRELEEFTVRLEQLRAETGQTPEVEAESIEQTP